MVQVGNPASLLHQERDFGIEFFLDGHFVPDEALFVDFTLHQKVPAVFFADGYRVLAGGRLKRIDAVNSALQP